MNTTIPVYDVVIDDDTLGLTAISLVDYPAIQENWIAFSEQQMMYLSSHDKREVVAPVLLPDQLILRKAEDGSLYYIRWKRETILQAAEKYIANGWFNNFTYQHAYFYNKDMKYEDTFEKDIYMLRMWTIEDENDDAYTKYHFNHLPLGTLMCHFKCHSRKLWQKIKNKEVMGVSIEAFTNIVRDNNNKVNIINMDVNSKQLNLFQKFIQFLNDVSAEASDISDIAKKDETDSGNVSLKYFIDDEHFIEVDAEGFARDEEYNLVAEGEYLLADGNTLVVDANNKFVETKAAGEEKAEEPIEAPIAESKVEEDEKKDEDTKEDEGKSDGEGNDAEPKGDAVGDEKGAESPAEENDEDKRKVAGAEIDEEPKEEEITVEEPVEEIPSALVPFEIDGVEYQLPQEVVDYINSLIGANEATLSELALMKERMPSASPIPSVITQSTQESEINGLSDAIRMLNWKR